MSSSQFCKHCVSLGEIPGQPAGQDETVGGVKSYIAKGSGKKGAVVIATDIFGLAIPNSMILADNYAKKTGYDVIVPDIFNGDPMKPDDFKLKKHTNDPEPDGSDKNFDNFGAWLQKGHGPDNSYPLFKKVLEARAADGPVAAIGYCYGGKLAALAAKDGLVKGAVINHPAMLEKGEAKEIKGAHVLINASETDPIFADEVKSDWFDTLKANGLLDSNSKTYKGAVHGHAVRPDLSKPDIKAAYEETFANTAAFIEKVLA